MSSLFVVQERFYLLLHIEFSVKTNPPRHGRLAWSSPPSRYCCCYDCLCRDPEICFFYGNWNLEVNRTGSTGFSVSRPPPPPSPPPPPPPGSTTFAQPSCQFCVVSRQFFPWRLTAWWPAEVGAAAAFVVSPRAADRPHGPVRSRPALLRQGGRA